MVCKSVVCILCMAEVHDTDALIMLLTACVSQEDEAREGAG